MLDIANHPFKPQAGSRKVPFSRRLYIDASDFCEFPPPKYFRLAPGREVRLKGAYIIKCISIEKNAQRIHCIYDPASRGGNAADGRKVRGTIHWLSAPAARQIEVRLYDTLFSVPEPEKVIEGHDYKENLNPHSLTIIKAYAEPALSALAPSARVQFERIGYFYLDPKYAKAKVPVFNRIVKLKDTWAKQANKK